MKPYYEHGSITIYHGDSREILPAIGSASIGVVLTSPPYNLGEGMEDKGGLRIGHSGSKWGRDALVAGYGQYADAMPYSEYVAWQQETLRECWRVIGSTGAIYYQHKPRLVKRAVRLPLALIPPGLPLRQIVIWNRGSGFNYMAGAYMPMHEWLLVLAKPDFHLRDKGASGVGDVWTIPPEIDTPHPAPFPLALAARVVETTSASVYLDPFMGIGTTLRAAKDLGRAAIGIEIEERYCETAVKRLEQEVLGLGGVA